MMGDAHLTHLLSSLADASFDGMLAFDRELRCTLWNHRMESITGLRAERMLGQKVFELFPYLLEAGDERYVRDALAGNTIRRTERPFHVAASHRRGFYDATYSPWQAPDGQILGAICVVRDLTESKRTEAQLGEVERRFKNMADAAPVLLWMANTEGLCTFFNQTWLDFTGRNMEDEWGVGWAEGVHFEDFQRCMDTFVQAFNQRAVFEMEYRLLRKDGVYRWILDRGTPRYAPDGTFAGFIGSCVDITERKALEEDLRRAVRARDEFLSIASHELRTPLTALQLQLERMLRSLQRADSIGEALLGRTSKNASHALRKTRHLGHMVDVLLDVSRLSEGRLDLEYGEVDLVEIAREVGERLHGYAAEVGCTVQLEGSDRAVGHWDRFRIEQVITNLLTNALKYGAGKPVQVRITDDGSSVSLCVSDLGPGIPAVQRDEIFERFARFASSRNYGGFGLGLWITREIVRLHGGSIRVESDASQGSTFEVVLPTQPPHGPAPAQASEEPPRALAQGAS